MFDDQQRQFIRNLLHQVLHSALHATIWRLPTAVLVVLIAAAIGVIWYFRLF